MLAGSKRGIQRREDLREAVEAEPRLVDQPAGQDLRKVQARQLHARGNNGLVGGKLRALARIQREGLVAVAEHVPAAQVEPIAETVIDLHQEIVAVDDVGKAVRIVRLGSRNVLLREEAEDRRAQRILRPAGGGVRGPRGGDVRRARAR